MSLQQLRDRWPEYRKGMTPRELCRRLDLAAVERAAVAIPELRAFLDDIGLLE